VDALFAIRMPALVPAEEAGRQTETPPAPMQPTDEALLAAIGDGDQEALALLFRRYARQVRGVAYRILRDASEADDLLQEVLLLIYRKCATFDTAKGPARFWILQITYRCAISRRRYLASRHFYTRVDLEDVVREEYCDASVTEPYSEMIAGLLGDGCLERTFRELSENQRRTLRLYFFEGYSLAEIAEQLGQSVGNVRHHYFRGLEKLRKRIFAEKLQAAGTD